MKLLDEARQRYRTTFAAAPTHAAVAPGRVNLIGEHTDYNGGFVLPMAIDRHTVVVGAVAEPPGAVVSSSEAEPAPLMVDGRFAAGDPPWANYVRGVFAGFMERGIVPPSVNMAIVSNVPIGGGLSSSAALEVAVATMLEAMTGHTLDPLDKALLCQWAENNIAGAPCGLMDQYTVVHGRAGQLVLLDCEALAAELVPLDASAATVLVADTRVKHAVGGGEYGARRKQCEEAAAALGRKLLRGASRQDLEGIRGSLPDVVYRRARHVITEIDRTQAAAEALKRGDLTEVGRLMAESHVSMRDDFEISCQEVEAMVAAFGEVGADGGVYGARLTGGGFGGCVVALVAPQMADAIASDVSTLYQNATGIEPNIFATPPADGARAVPIADTKS